MRVTYTWLRKRLSASSKQLMLMTALICLPITARMDRVSTASPGPQPPDARALRLKRFLLKLHCPVSYLADDFVHAADDNQLDWRLLPSISVIESGGGKAYKNNNIFGWKNGEAFFPTLRAGLHEVAFKLGRSSLYQNRDSVEKLRLYNPDATYPDAVLSVMNQIAPRPQLAAEAR
jgi:hypothetical protein